MTTSETVERIQTFKSKSSGNLFIRPVRTEDVTALAEMRAMKGVRETISSVSSERVTSNENYLNGLSSDDHMFIAEVEEDGIRRVVGSACLSAGRRPRNRHTGVITLMVHASYQGQGIGRKLIETLLDLADNWLMLVRCELEVQVQNHNAIKLYESLGFVHEGVRKYAAVNQGRYVDVCMMGRYRLSSSR